MPLLRFPRARYVRELAVMHDDLEAWRAMYANAAIATTSDHLAGRFSGRAIVLEDIVHQLALLETQVAALPRIT
jgi:hypothetical protein